MKLNLAITSFILTLLLSCAQSEKKQSSDKLAKSQAKRQKIDLRRPLGNPAPTQIQLIEAQNELAQNEIQSAIVKLNSFQPKTSFEQAWKDYLLGLAFFESKQWKQGNESLLNCYEPIRSSAQNNKEIFRVAGLCLKKLGWYQRKLKNYQQALAYHQIRYRYVSSFGSPWEIHDALISMDVDAYFLKDMHLSFELLKQSIETSQKISDPSYRSQALGTAYNNLAGTLYTLERFEASVDAIKMALRYWQQFEGITNQKQFKLVWAHYGVGDVYENWAKFLKKKGKNYGYQKDEAKKAYSLGLQLGEGRALDAVNQDLIRRRIQKVESL